MNKDKQAGIVILPEHQKRSDLPAILEAFKKYNRFAMGEMTGDELRASRINPNELRYFGAEVYQYFDPDHSHEEDRFILLGISYKLRLLVICHCFRESDTVIRIISARKADGDEENEYWRNRQ